MTLAFIDAEDAALEFFKGNSVGTAVSGQVYRRTPEGNPLPRINLYQAGGSPAVAFPAEEARISVECWAASRGAAKQIALAVLTEVEALADSGDVPVTGGRIAAGTVLNKLYLPDPVSGLPRCIVDVRFVIVQVD